VLNYLDLHASSPPHNIFFFLFLRFLFGLGCLWLSGISGLIAYNWSRLNMKTGVKIIHPSSCYGKVPVTRKGFFFSTLFFLPSIFFNNLSQFFLRRKEIREAIQGYKGYGYWSCKPLSRTNIQLSLRNFSQVEEKFCFHFSIMYFYCAPICCIWSLFMWNRIMKM